MDTRSHSLLPTPHKLSYFLLRPFLKAHHNPTYTLPQLLNPSRQTSMYTLIYPHFKQSNNMHRPLMVTLLRFRKSPHSIQITSLLHPHRLALNQPSRKTHLQQVLYLQASSQHQNPFQLKTQVWCIRICTLSEQNGKRWELSCTSIMTHFK